MSSDPIQAGRPDAAAPAPAPGRSMGPWRPAAAGYFLFALAGLAAGFWPGAIHHPAALQAGPVPALQSLAVAQVAFFLLVYPLILARRARGASSLSPAGTPVATTSHAPFVPATATRESFWIPCAIESACLLAATAPLYAAAAFLADAVWTDCLRSAAAVACLCPLSWAAGRCLAPRGDSGARGWTSAVVILLLVAAVGLPWAQYVCRDFLGARRAAVVADAIWRAAPATFAWDAAAARSPHLWPRPAWVILLWLAAAAGLAALPARRRLAP